ncbi:unnamed protein product [Trichobilharzia regenti]|nr:unnamed protein product [Trichobilharzia regenti]
MIMTLIVTLDDTTVDTAANVSHVLRCSEGDDDDDGNGMNEDVFDDFGDDCLANMLMYALLLE